MQSDRSTAITARTLFAGAALFLAVTAPERAFAQYSNNFQSSGSENSQLTPGGTITALGRVSLPTDGGGIGSVNQSMWLGRIGSEIGKSTSTSELVTLGLTGLTPGAAYLVKFDLFIGASWDGAANGYGNDGLHIYASSGAITTDFINTTFSICNSQICGAYSPQSYSDLTPLGTSGAIYGAATGSEFSVINDRSYGNDYAIYYFGHGAGNPVLSFIAGATTADIVFERPPTYSTDSADEYWALDNIEVNGVVTDVDDTVTPEPASMTLLATGLAGVAGVAARRRKKSAL